jgi:hypothetical protein
MGDQPPTRTGAHAALSFTLTRAPLAEDEQAILRDDLTRLGVDETVWLILNGMIQTGTRATIPKVLRAHRDGALVGAAYVIECRKLGRCFFDDPLATMMDTPGLPMFLWTRNGIMTDSNANPGFVAPGVEREAFVAQAVHYLQRRYLYGVVLDVPAAVPAADCVSQPLFDSGSVLLRGFSGLDDYLARGKNLRRKISKFKNKGGTIEVVRGAMTPVDREAAERCFGAMKPLVFTPYQDNYVRMAMQSCSIASDRLVHIIARFDGEFAGYQSFALSGDGLYCLSGIFDRNRNSNYHAYENVIVESVRLGLEQGLRVVDYGPITNESKLKMMTSFQRAEMRIHSRFAPVRGLLPLVVQRSKLAPQVYRAYTGVAEAQPAAA